jgi:Xaa-Pro aminopeptidase
MTRTIGIECISAEKKKVYELVLDAQKISLKALAVNKAACQIDQIARDIIAEAGFGQNFGHGLGHGVGLEIHEAPTLNSSSTETLGHNMIVTIEPGIYVPQSFGIRIEDLALVTNSDIIILSNSEKDLIII